MIMDIEAIQGALRQFGVNGWLFFDHHRRDPLAYEILGLPEKLHPTRRWYYFVPAQGEPVALVHKIESHILDALPGSRREYAGWEDQRRKLGQFLQPGTVVAMQYSPDCAIPVVSLVDGGTIELVRGFGVTVVSSADLVQMFQAVWSEAQRESHFRAGKIVDEIRRAAFAEIARRLAAREPVDEWTIRSFILRGFEQHNLVTSSGPIVAVNEHASDPHYEPTADSASRIQPGDLVLIDLWAKFSAPGSVYYDITWTGYCGSDVPDEIRNVFDVVRGARDSAVEFVRASIAGGRLIRGFEVDDVSRLHITERGYAEHFIHRTGHSIGTEVHGVGANMDNLESHDDRRVLPRTCFSIEPGVYLRGFGIRSEVNVYVTEADASVTGELQTAVIAIPVGA